MRVFVLGHKGMLGHMVVKYLKSQKIDIATTSKRFPYLDTKMFTDDIDYIINCIGAIPQRTTDFKINYELPEWLNKLDIKIIHPGTDCEMDIDEYGQSKKKASDYIKMYSSNTKILKTSIIGPELNSCASLMEWFLSQDNEVQGYTKAMWNGNTTLEWAKQCLLLMNNWNRYDKETIIATRSISKYEMLLILKNLFNKEISIQPIGKGKDKCLSGDIDTGDLTDQIIELKQFYYNNFDN
tara:strand:+ start:468 stop:1184 length:717 start_codon:yes stop_codon:yes gene_type:complete